MKVVTLKFKKNVKHKIKDTQRAYDFMCPIDNIEPGEFVLVEVKIRDRADFMVARVESVIDFADYKSIDGQTPYSYVICKIPVRDFEKRLDSVKKMKHKTMCRNGQIRARNRKKQESD